MVVVVVDIIIIIIIIQVYLWNISNTFVAFCGQVLLSRGTSTRAQVTGVRLKTFIKEGKTAVQLQKLCNFRKPLHTPR